MNRLQEVRTQKGLTQVDLSNCLKAEEPKIDVPMVSRYEHGVCLPTKKQMEALEKLLGTDRTALYDIEELDLLDIGETQYAPENAKTCGRPKDQRSRQFFRKCFRISRNHEARLPDDLLEVCGFTSWQSWFDSSLRHLEAQYAERKRKTKTA